MFYSCDSCSKCVAEGKTQRETERENYRGRGLTEKTFMAFEVTDALWEPGFLAAVNRPRSVHTD